MADVWGGVDRCSWRLAASRGRRSAAELGAQIPRQHDATNARAAVVARSGGAAASCSVVVG